MKIFSMITLKREAVCRVCNKAIPKGEKVLKIEFYANGNICRGFIGRDCMPDILEQMEEVRKEYLN